MTTTTTHHILPTGPFAERAVLTGDPGRALMLAQTLLAEPRMCNHNRGLWGYTGTAADGEPLTIQSTGMGGPSAAIVFTELASLGVRYAIRAGTCGALDGALELGELLVVTQAIAVDGASRALGASERVAGDPALTGALRAAAPDAAAGPIVSSDLFYDPASAERSSEWLAAGALAVEMEAAALFVLGPQLGAAVGCVLAVSDVVSPGGQRRRLDEDALRAAGERVGRLAAAGLGVQG